MNIKVLGTVTLSALLLLSGCGKSDNANTVNVNANRAANTTTTTTNTAVPANTPPLADTVTKTVVEEALKRKNLSNDITVEATTTQVILRGTVPKGKMAEAVQAAQEAGKKPVKNELTEK
ncbi:MAG: hypothetical protein JWN60_916 [Acidobacteria bacterium]|jgi:osmotically-inducible protein OsmY|nr:hypothetical protein [Acidobacteriota bacterium]